MGLAKRIRCNDVTTVNSSLSESQVKSTSQTGPLNLLLYVRAYTENTSEQFSMLIQSIIRGSYAQKI